MLKTTGCFRWLKKKVDLCSFSLGGTGCDGSDAFLLVYLSVKLFVGKLTFCE